MERLEHLEAVGEMEWVEGMEKLVELEEGT
jgi:hypothetical protein